MPGCSRRASGSESQRAVFLHRATPCLVHTDIAARCPPPFHDGQRVSPLRRRPPPLRPRLPRRRRGAVPLLQIALPTIPGAVPPLLRAPLPRPVGRPSPARGAWQPRVARLVQLRGEARVHRHCLRDLRASPRHGEALGVGLHQGPCVVVPPRRPYRYRRRATRGVVVGAGAVLDG